MYNYDINETTLMELDSVEFNEICYDDLLSFDADETETAYIESITEGY